MFYKNWDFQINAETRKVQYKFYRKNVPFFFRNRGNRDWIASPKLNLVSFTTNLFILLMLFVSCHKNWCCSLFASSFARLFKLDSIIIREKSFLLLSSLCLLGLVTNTINVNNFYANIRVLNINQSSASQQTYKSFFFIFLMLILFFPWVESPSSFLISF